MMRFVLSLMFSLLLTKAAFGFESDASHVFLYDIDTKTVLYAKKPDHKIIPGSMTKLATSLMVFEALKSGTIKMDQPMSVSEKAWREGGAPSGRTTMFAKLKSKINTLHLLRGLTAIMANDAALVLAENMEGSEASFVNEMNKKAKKIGLTATKFQNVTGAYDENHHTTVRDLVKLAQYTITHHLNRLPLFSQKSFTWNKVRQTNKNKALANVEGLEGFFYGSDEPQNLFGFVGSASRNGRRILFAFHGIDTVEGRDQEIRKIVDHAFNNYKPLIIAQENEIIAYAKTHKAKQGKMPLIGANGAVKALLPKQGQERIKVKILYKGPLKAPMKKHTKTAMLFIERDGLTLYKTPLMTQANLEEGSFLQKSWDGVRTSLKDWFFELKLLQWLQGKISNA